MQPTALVFHFKLLDSENKPRGLYFSKALFKGVNFSFFFWRGGGGGEGGLIFGGALSTEGNWRFKIVRASLIVDGKCTVFALFYFVFQGNFSSTSPQRAYIWRGDLTEVFFALRFGGLSFEIVRYIGLWLTVDCGVFPRMVWSKSFYKKTP